MRRPSRAASPWGPDLARAKGFYEALGRRGQEVEETVFFQTGGLALAVWDREKPARDCGVEPGPGGGFGGIALAHSVGSEAEVDEVPAAARRAGGAVTKPAAVNAIGFYSSAFTDPDGHCWEVAHNPGFPSPRTDRRGPPTHPFE
ncbi:VOC family protein [Streptomyces sp. NPDC054945]